MRYCCRKLAIAAPAVLYWIRVRRDRVSRRNGPTKAAGRSACVHLEDARQVTLIGETSRQGHLADG